MIIKHQDQDHSVIHSFASLVFEREVIYILIWPPFLRVKSIGRSVVFSEEHSCRKIVDLDKNKHCSKLQAAEQTVVG